MPHDLALKAMNGAHRLLLAVTRGRVGYDALGMPVLELTTVGRRSGEARSVMLTAPLEVDGHPVIVASRGGDDRHPAWFLNLRAHPEVQVSMKGGPRTPMHARIVGPDERAQLWPRIAGRYPNYAGYQRRTTREIPLVVLEPAG
ncbi:MAG: nitroreductase/quinone reductase family protein [Pseudonocardiales bacterium]|jgi:deazaflavin-dependent oxidoreductase (nitroreductase family)|nr:nitroreductase/quinone reductase family protein [Pseudonocardiales bacterium]